MLVKDKHLIVTMPDGSRWAIPVLTIAINRARYYAEQDKVSYEDSLYNDTLPLFECDEYEIHDWAANNMYWYDVADFAKRVIEPLGVDYEEGWMNGDWEVK